MAVRLASSAVWGSAPWRHRVAPARRHWGSSTGKITRDEALTHARNIVAATDNPVSADLEHGFGDSPELVAETIRLAADVGLVGGSIEDATGYKDKPLYDMSHAVERIAAAVAAARRTAVSLHTHRAV